MNNIPIKNEVKSILAKKGLTMTHVVELINNNRSSDNKTSVQNLNNKLTRESIKYTEMVELANVLGFDIKWIPR
jgi:hypothetical protein